MNYSKIINQALEITKKHRHLWWLSLLAMIGGVAHESGGESANFNINTSGADFNQLSPQIKEIAENFFDKIHLYLPIIIIVVLVIILINITLFIIGLMAKSGLIASIDQIDQNKKSSFSQGMSLGKKFAWKLFLIRLLGGITQIAITIVAIPLMLILFFLFFLTIPALIVVFIIAGLIFQIAQIIMIINQTGVLEAIKISWKLFINKWKEIALLWLINLGFGIAIGIVILTIMFLLGTIGGILGYTLYLLKIHIAMIILITSPIILIMFIVTILFGSISTTFFTSFWTLGIKNLIITKK